MTALACVGALVMAPGALAQTDDDFDPVKGVNDIVSPGGITSHSFDCEESRPEVQDIVQGVKRSLKVIYPNISTMTARGFYAYFDAPLFGVSGGQGHWLNPGFLEDGHVMDPERPEGILTDKWNRPIGVMFITDDPDSRGPDLYVADDGTPCNAWHYHSEITADSYWHLYRYGWRGDLSRGDWQPDERSPDLMHVWAYGADGIGTKADGTQENLYKYQWTHAKPPDRYMPGNPDSPEDFRNIVGGPRTPVDGPNP